MLSRSLLLALTACLHAIGAVKPPEGPPKRESSCNTPTDRACWTSGFNINTDYELYTPTTGVERAYTLTLTEMNAWTGPDGVVRTKVMLVNGQFPGPTITADWGDCISVTVVNNLVTNGTSIHWHGIRQLNTNIADGTPGVTECPIPPGGSKTYTFEATQYGTTWYHSHFSSQYGYGVLGPIVINGPASANYDIDLGPFLVSDWYYEDIDDLLLRVQDPNDPFTPGLLGSPPTSDNILLNGTNINPLGSGGSYARVELTPGKLHRLRLVNPSVENTFSVSLVGHSFTIIATDLVPVEPVTVDSIYLSIGQRYDVIINASQPVDSYWFNVTMPTGPCGSTVNPYPAAIFSYVGANNTTPTTQGTAPPDAKCADSLTYTPVVTRTADVAAFTPSAADTLNTTVVAETLDNATSALVYWPVNGTPMNVSWNNPTLQFVKDSDVSSMPGADNVVSVSSANTMTFWLLQNNSSIPHPIHLHGHDILVLGASAPLADPLTAGSVFQPYDPSTDAATLNGANPTRRDTTVLPAYGWLAVSYVTNNPGAWLFHCHVAWHVSQGLSVQFIEQVGTIASIMPLGAALDETCPEWNAYFPAEDPFPKVDSGL